MRNIVIVEAVSTGINFIEDVVNRGFNPVVLQTKVPETEDGRVYLKMIKESHDAIELDFDMIYEKDSYEETLDMVRQYDPLLVIPGSEKGVILATKLAADLGLKGNPVENIDALTLKHKMQEKLAENGLRHIRGRVVRSPEEAVKYYDEENLERVVIKPTYSAGSVGVRICLNRREMIDSITKLFNDVNIYGDHLEEFVIQEFIDGTEYCVNTVSHDGDHRITTIWKYNKITTPEGGHIYDYRETVNELGLGEADLIEYVYDVEDALGIRYGAVHGEYMVDEKGPVLIEVNCRPSGPNMPAKFMDKISGQHETDSILDSYLNPDNFYYERDKGYNLHARGVLKYFIVPRGIIAESSPMVHISNNLKSHYKTTLEVIDEPKPFVKTQDLETTGGIVYLAHEDGYVVQKDLDFLCSVERYAFQLVLSQPSERKLIINLNESHKHVKSILNVVLSYGSTVLITDQIYDDISILQVEPDKIDDIKGEFSCVVVNLNKSIMNNRDDYVTYLFLKIISKVKVGGLIFIPQATYKCLPNGRIGAEAFIKVLDLKIELPLHHINRVLIASKR